MISVPADGSEAFGPSVPGTARRQAAHRHPLGGVSEHGQPGANGKPGVSGATRQSVLSALDVLGHERPARLVAPVLPEPQNPIFPAFAEVVGGALAQQGPTPVLGTRIKGRSPGPVTSSSSSNRSWSCVVRRPDRPAEIPADRG